MTKADKVLSTLNKEELIDYYSKHSTKHSAMHFDISERLLKQILILLNIEKHSKLKNSQLTCLEKYGCSNPSKDSSIKKKIKDSKLERYGDANFNNKEKRQETCLDRYGSKSASGNSEIKNKVKITNISRYGYDNPFKDKINIEQKRKDKYGSIDIFFMKQQEARVRSFISRYGVENASQVPGSRARAFKKIPQTCLRKYGVPYATLLPQCQFSSGNSANTKPNIEFATLLNNKHIQYEQEFTIHKYSYDFKALDTILIEINPAATHNSTWSPFGEKNIKDSNYHKNKSQIAKDNNYRCIHVWDWDDSNKIISMLQPKEKLYARKLTLQEVDKQLVDTFLNSYHLQNTCRGQTFNYGLFYNNELVQIMTFGKPRYNKKYEYELLRLCTHPNYKVVGGSARLFKSFIKNIAPSSIISYCDNAKFNGDVYNDLGFIKKNHSSPSLHWYNPKTGEHITDNLLRQRGFDQLFKTNHGKGVSNDELMLANNFIQIWDCGQSSYIWQKEARK